MLNGFHWTGTRQKELPPNGIERRAANLAIDHYEKACLFDRHAGLARTIYLVAYAAGAQTM